MLNNTLHQRIEKHFAEAYNEGDCARRYRIVRNMGPTDFRKLWLNASTQQEFDAAVDAYGEKMSRLGIEDDAKCGGAA
jgi:hypothetical protein